MKPAQLQGEVDEEQDEQEPLHPLGKGPEFLLLDPEPIVEEPYIEANAEGEEAHEHHDAVHEVERRVFHAVQGQEPAPVREGARRFEEQCRDPNVVAVARDRVHAPAKDGCGVMAVIHAHVGPVVAANIVSFFSDHGNLQMIQKLKQYGVGLTHSNMPSARKNSLFVNKTFVVTGTLSSMKREELKSKVLSLGAKFSGSISKSTDYLVAGGGAGSKLIKAETLGVKVLNELEFIALITPSNSGEL